MYFPEKLSPESQQNIDMAGIIRYDFISDFSIGTEGRVVKKRKAS